MNKMWLIVPALSDLLTTTLHYNALNFLAGSVYQMMRGGTIITTLILSIILLGMPVQKKQVAGSSLALIGILIVGISSVAFSSSSSSGSDAVFFIFI